MCFSEEFGNNNPDFDPKRMNRVVRHRLRNLCAGVRMTMDRIAKTTAETHPEITSRCNVVNAELDGLRIFTERMDLLFDEFPPPTPLPLHALITQLRQNFSSRHPLCSLSLQGEPVALLLPRGTWVAILLGELLDNAAEAAALSDVRPLSVRLAWKPSESRLLFEIENPGTIPDEIPLAPPVMFTTRKSRHDGIGLSIAWRFCRALGGDLSFRPTDGEAPGVFAVLSLPVDA